MEPLPEPVARVAAYLAAAGGEARIEDLGSSCASAAQAAEAVGCAPGQIVKSLALVCGGEAVVALVPGDRRADLARIAAVVGRADCRTANAEEVLAITGFAPGSVAPFPHAAAHHVLIDRSLLACHVVWAGAGSDRHLVAMGPRELVRVSQARVAAIAR
jgi:prolyl-tRNA editing enzyme YbaK/EbsC (Cys-tRNA(Pro) deacylase)